MNSSTSSSPVTDSMPDLTTASPSSAYLPVRLNNLHVNALLDTGNSFHNLISWSCFQSLGFSEADLRPLPPSVRPLTANSEPLRVLGVPIGALRLFVGMSPHPIKIRPVVIADASCALNLCTAFMSKHNFVLNLGARSVSYLNRSFPLLSSPADAVSATETSSRAYCAHTITVPPRHSRYVRLRLPGVQAGLVPAQDGLSKSSPSFEGSTDLNPYR